MGILHKKQDGELEDSAGSPFGKRRRLRGACQ